MVKGAVKFEWSFVGERQKASEITCHVLPKCSFDLILGNPFLKATETMSRYRNRLSRCLFRTRNVLGMSYMSGGSGAFLGLLNGKYQIFALPDSGAERNVMNLQCVYLPREYATMMQKD